MKQSLLCLVLTGNTLQGNIEVLEKYRDYIDLVELRADFLNSAELSALDRFPEYLGIRAVLTIRRKQEGGFFLGTEEQRRELLFNASRGNWAFVDIETDFHDPKLESLFKKRKIRIIRSFHDFEGVPADLVKRMKAVRRGEIPKAAVMPKSTGELYRLLAACKKLKTREKIVLAMGDHGTPTRILATKLGSFLSYCSLPASDAAPGHLDPFTMFALYHFREITKKTRLFGIIGNPITHSFSPQIHNKGFRDLGIDAVYVPFLVDNVEAFFKIARLLNIEGFSVTIPHKSAVMPFLTQRDALVDTIGACNTVVKRGRAFSGWNTDVTGFLEPLKKYFPADRLKSICATVIGAGGAARAVVSALKAAGARILILNRTVERAKMLADEFGAAWAPLANAGFYTMKDYSDIIVQTTNVGMDPDTDSDPLEGHSLTGNELIYDLIYAPRLSKLLERALESGCKVINGEEMLVAQAHEQFRLFTGRESSFKNYFITDIIRCEDAADTPPDQET
jgi:3-dehydroquinate dehydratase/shikimate dehydrogenase